MGVSIRVKIDDAAVLAGLKATRREMNQDVKRALLAAGTELALPRAKSLAPSIARGSLTVKATTRNAVLTTTARGTLRSVIGLLEYGGTVSTTIVPTRKKALLIPGVGPRARVTGPRTYRAKRFLRRAAEASRPAMERRMADEITDIIQARVDGARR